MNDAMDEVRRRQLARLKGELNALALAAPKAEWLN
jgi:hypothetical protein